MTAKTKSALQLHTQDKRNLAADKRTIFLTFHKPKDFWPRLATFSYVVYVLHSMHAFTDLFTLCTFFALCTFSYTSLRCTHYRQNTHSQTHLYVVYNFFSKSVHFQTRLLHCVYFHVHFLQCAHFSRCVYLHFTFTIDIILLPMV